MTRSGRYGIAGLLRNVRQRAANLAALIRKCVCRRALLGCGLLWSGCLGSGGVSITHSLCAYHNADEQTASYSHVHWVVPIVFSGFFGFGIVTCFSGIFTFQVESYPLYAASALGANSFARSAFAAGFPLFGVQMYHNLGPQWATSVLAFISLALAPFPYIFFKYGKRIRKHSRFATP